MPVWGISALSHDASLAVIDGDEVVFAAHAERYSRVKNDPMLHPELWAEALRFGRPDAIAWYERPYLKKVRHLRAGQWAHAFSRADVPRAYLRSLGLPFALPPVSYYGHHQSHAMAGIATSGFDDAAVIVADAIGEFDTFTIWRYTRAGGLEPLYRRRYPDSLGLLYSAFTRRCGFRPNEDEYILMGMAGFGEARHEEQIEQEFIDIEAPGFRLRRNVHRGIGDWLPDSDVADLAASMQAVAEKVLLGAARWARDAAGSPNLVLMGGVALNCMANARIGQDNIFDRIWIFPNPGDAGSSVGAAAAHHGGPLAWPGPYLGTAIERELDPAAVVKTLRTDGTLAVANGRAEFGPRALGNRSILADPRSLQMKDRVNQIKGREMFRPFAPVIREEVAHRYFELPAPTTPYMQFTARCTEPDSFPAVVHVDGTSRVQTVSAAQHPTLYEILVQWEAETGCPMLLNTSLNSRGEPLVNTWAEACAFSAREGIQVL